MEAMIGMDKCIALVAENLVKHWETRYAAMEGKAMVVFLNPVVFADAGAATAGIAKAKD